MEQSIPEVVGVVDESGTVVCAYRKDENKDALWRAVVSVSSVGVVNRWQLTKGIVLYYSPERKQ